MRAFSSLRLLLRTPRLAATAVALLALGIGGLTAVAALLDAAVLRPLRVPEPDRLVRVFSAKDGQGERASTWADFVDWRAATGPVLGGLAAGAATSVAVEGESRLVAAALVSDGWFGVLGVPPVAGSLAAFDAAALEGEPVVALGAGFAASRFGDPRAAVGRDLGIQGSTYRVVAVLPAELRGVTLAERPRLWIPASRYDDVARGFWANFRAADYDAQRTGNRMAMWHLVGRLAPEADIAALRETLAAADTDLAERFPSTNASLRAEVAPAVATALPAEGRGAATGLLELLLAAVLVGLAVTCVSLGGLMMVRARSRRHEMAVRRALGAGSARLARLVLAESAWIAAAGAAGGVLLAHWLLDAARGFRLPGGVAISALEPRIDAALLAVVLGATVLALVVWTSAPLAGIVGRRAVEGLRFRPLDDGPGSTRFRQLAIAAQLALASVLLVVLASAAGSYRHAAAIDPGFEPSGVATLTVDLGPTGRDADGARAFFEQTLEAVRALPGVSHAALTSTPFGEEGISVGTVRVRDGGLRQDLDVPLVKVSRDYFRTLGIPLERGAVGSPGGRWAVVDRTFADAVFPGSDPVGAGIDFSTRGGDFFEVVAVAAPSSFRELGERRTAVYLPLESSWSSAAGDPTTFLVRTTADPRELLVALEDRVRRFGPDVPVVEARALADRVGALLLPHRMAVSIVGFFSLYVTAMATVALGGALAWTVRARRRELGLRRALGARAPDLLRETARGVVPAVAGGLLAGALATVLVRPRIEQIVPELVEVSAISVLGASIALGGALLLAMLPSLRDALAVEPAVVLREE